MLAQEVSSSAIIKEAESNGIAILKFQQFGVFRVLFPWKEHDVQQWFLLGHQDALRILGRVYALMHIPGTVW